MLDYVHGVLLWYSLKNSLDYNYSPPMQYTNIEEGTLEHGQSSFALCRAITEINFQKIEAEFLAARMGGGFPHSKEIP